jgi:hypothetical protein
MRGAILGGVLSLVAVMAAAQRFPAQQTMQQKISLLRPFPFCVVYLQRSQVDTLETIREQFATIRSLGFTCLKQLIPSSILAMNQTAANAYVATVGAGREEGGTSDAE